MNIKQTILAIIKEYTPIQVVVGKVVSVDNSLMVCEVEIQGRPSRLDVRLRSVIDEQEKGILIYPKVNSYVLVGLIENKLESSFICGYSEIDKIRLLNCNIELNNDTYGGIVISQRVADELNGIKQDINTLKTVLSTWVVAPGDGGAALKAAAATWAGSQLVIINKTDLENNKVKHG